MTIKTEIVKAVEELVILLNLAERKNINPRVSLYSGRKRRAKYDKHSAWVEFKETTEVK